MNKFRVALCQLAVGKDKQQNVKNAIEKIRTAVEQHHSQMVVLPECFNSPYGTEFFEEYSEQMDQSDTWKQISSIAKELKVTIVAGSIPAKDKQNKIYNASAIFASDGSHLATYCKNHLFDINVPGKISFQESKTLTAGDHFTIIQDSSNEHLPNNFRFGVGICFDIRFTEMATLMTQKYNTQMLVYPGAFNTTTGPLHWELLARARAVDNQSYVIVCSPARDNNAGYKAWGHSMVVDPWGKIVAEADEKETIVCADIDLQVVQEFRNSIPTLANRRSDLYETIHKKSM